MRRLSTLVATLVVAALPLRAQEPATRAGEEAARQAEKAKNLRAERLNFIQKQLIAFEAGGGFGAPRGFMATFGDIKKGSGFAPGVAYGKLFNNGTVVMAKTAWSIRNFKMAQLSVTSPALAAERLRVSSRVRWQDAPTLAFYPLGTPSPKLRADYSETKTEATAAATFRPFRMLHMEGSIGFEAYETGGGAGRNPRIEALFPGAAVPGVNADPDYLHTMGSAEFDSRDGEGYSRRGSLLRATLHDYRQQDTGAYTFQRLDGVLEQYIPILHGNWVLYGALRASTTTPAEGHEVPFFMMPDLGGSSLRGYGNYRFRDRHTLLFTAEYRWYAQEFVEMAIFYDAGKAVARRADLDFSGLKSDVGLGIRFHGPQATILRIEAARGREGTRIIFAFSPVGG